MHLADAFIQSDLPKRLLSKNNFSFCGPRSQTAFQQTPEKF